MPTEVWYKAYPGLTLIDLERKLRPENYTGGTFVTEDMFAMGVSELELAPAVNQLYQQIYEEAADRAKAAPDPDPASIHDFELAAFRVATRALREIPPELFVEFEVSPATVRTARFRRGWRT